MKNKLIVSVLLTAPAVLFTAEQAALVPVEEGRAAVLAELQAVRAAGNVQLAAHRGAAAVAPYAHYTGNIAQWGLAGMGAGALLLWRFAGDLYLKASDLSAVLVLGGAAGVGFGFWSSERKRKNLRRKAQQEQARLQNEANCQARLEAAAQRIVELRDAAARAEQLRQEANERLERESQRHHTAEQANQQAVRDLAAQVGTNSAGLGAVIEGQISHLRLQRGPALVAAHMLRNSGNIAEAHQTEAALNGAEAADRALTVLRQQLAALPAPVAMPALAGPAAADPAAATPVLAPQQQAQRQEQQQRRGNRRRQVSEL